MRIAIIAAMMLAATAHAGSPALMAEFAAYSQPWSPANLPGLVLWLDASDAGTITITGSGVSEWRDKSGNGNHASQPTDARRPTYTQTHNGLNVVTFGLSAQKTMRTGAIAAMNTTNLLVASVARTANASDVQFMMQNKFTGGASGDSHRMLLLQIGFGPPRQYAQTYRNASGSIIVSATHPVGDYVVQITDWRNQGALRFTHNGTLDAFSGASDANPSGHVRLILSGEEGPADAAPFQRWFDGQIAEIVYSVVTPTDELRHKLEGYLAHKWGLQSNLPSNHPYRYARPLR